MKTNAQGIYCMHSGSLICSWNVCRWMENGHWCVPMNVQAWTIVMGMNSMRFIPGMRRREREVRRSRCRVYGLPFWIHRWRRVQPYMLFKDHCNKNPIRRIWEPSSVPTSVRRLWSIRHRMRLRFVILIVLVYRNWQLLRRIMRVPEASLILRSWRKSVRLWLVTWIALLIGTFTPGKNVASKLLVCFRYCDMHVVSTITNMSSHK